ncbi:MAG: flagellar hook-basal body protein [Oscillospiraceae bacterium]|nr:flagellar hook-basal body protein [Oscillospiraceae bacterium]
MRAAFYTGTSGLVAYQNSMDVIGNNIANCNTTGYKAQKTSFSQLLSSKMNNNVNPPYVGNGVRTIYTGIDSGEATFVPTQGSFDLAVSGNGWFGVEADGQRAYTRDGAFTLSVEGSTTYLTTQSGAYVLDSSGNRITATIDSSSKEIDTASMLERVGVFTFTNPEALTPASSNTYLPNAYTGTAVSAANNVYTVLKGYLEQSDVSLPDEMVALITAQRGYQLSARVVQTADEVEQTINSLRR